MTLFFPLFYKDQVSKMQTISYIPTVSPTSKVTMGLLDASLTDAVLISSGGQV